LSIAQPPRYAYNDPNACQGSTANGNCIASDWRCSVIADTHNPSEQSEQGFCFCRAAQGRTTIRRILHSGTPFLLPGQRRAAILLVFGFASLLWVGPMLAQSDLSAQVQNASGTGGMNLQDNSVSSGPDSGFSAVASNPGRTGIQANSSTTGSALWNHLLLDAFQLGIRSINSSGTAGNGMNFNGGPGGAASSGGVGRTGAGPGGNSTSLDSLFRMAGDLSSDLGAGKNGSIGTALRLLPKLNQLSRGGLNLPLNSSFGSFRLSYQNLFGGTGSPMGGRTGYGSPSASFNSTHMRTGKIDFSTAASVSSGFGMSAGISSFGGQSAGGASFSPQVGGSGGMDRVTSGGGGGPMGGQGSGPGGGPGRTGGAGGQIRPSASLSLHLNF
jgi:hypothetical protein